MHRRITMPKYLNTKPGSLESAVLEAVSPAQQAAIAISKKEKGEKPKKEKDEGNAFGAALQAAKDNGDDEFVVSGKTYKVKEAMCPKCEGKGCDHCEGKGYHEDKLVGGQKKLDKDKDGDIDGKDFAMMRKAKKEEVKEETSLAELAAKHISDMWAEAAKSDKKEEEEPKAKKETKTTMTGKPMSNIEVTPSDKEDK